MKKFASIALVVLLMLLLPHEVSASHLTGQNIRDGGGTIYFLDKDGSKRPYTSAAAFLSYRFNTWASVSTGDSDDLQKNTGQFVPPRDGKIICADRGVEKGTCYLMSNGNKVAFTSAKLFFAQGFSFQKALTGDVSFLGSGGLISDLSQPHMPGTVIRKGNTLYFVGNNGLYGIPSELILKSWGYAFEDAVPINNADQNANLTVVGNLELRTPGSLSPLMTTVPLPVQSTNLQATQPYTVVQHVAPGDKQTEVFRVTLSSLGGNSTITQADLEFTGMASSTLSNISLYNGTTGQQLGSVAGIVNYTSMGIGFSAPVTLQSGNLFDLVVKADVNSAATGNYFSVGLNNLWITTGSSDPFLAAVNGLPLTSQPVTVQSMAKLGAITAPTGSDTWQAGQAYTIRWQTSGGSSQDTVRLMAIPIKKGCVYTNVTDLEKCFDASTVSSANYNNLIVSNSAPNTGNYNWTIPTSWQNGSGSVVIGVVSADDYDSVSLSQPFTIFSNSPSILIITPAGGESYQLDAPIPITWTTTNIPNGVKIRDVYLVDSLGKEIYITSDLPNTGSAQITLPKTLSDEQYSLELKAIVNGNLVTATSLSSFFIAPNASTSRDRNRLSDVRQFASALELYFNDFSKYPTSLSQLAPLYLTTVPTAPSPADGSCSYVQNTYMYTQLNGGNNYNLTFCMGGASAGYSAGAHVLSSSGIQ